jgi:hypothetical protein
MLFTHSFTSTLLPSLQAQPKSKCFHIFIFSFSPHIAVLAMKERKKERSCTGLSASAMGPRAGAGGSPCGGEPPGEGGVTTTSQALHTQSTADT